jgi:hypothetical protein
MLIGQDNIRRNAKIMANGIHIGYELLILSYLYYDSVLGVLIK